MPKFRIEVDGPVGQGVLVKDGEAMMDVTALSITMDPGHQVQVMTTEHTMIYAGRQYVADEHHIITRATLLIETAGEAIHVHD